MSTAVRAGAASAVAASAVAAGPAAPGVRLSDPVPGARRPVSGAALPLRPDPGPAA